MVRSNGTKFDFKMNFKMTKLSFKCLSNWLFHTNRGNYKNIKILITINYFNYQKLRTFIFGSFKVGALKCRQIIAIWDNFRQILMTKYLPNFLCFFLRFLQFCLDLAAAIEKLNSYIPLFTEFLKGSPVIELISMFQS